MMAQACFRGTSVYCGLDVSIQEIEKHLQEAARAGLTGVFTSVQLPEMDKERMLTEMPRLTAVAHEYGMEVTADVGKWRTDLFALKDLKAYKALGIDVMRLDGGYTIEETAEISHNDLGLKFELNLAHASEEYLCALETAGINKDAIRFCHNYYPMRYTGCLPEDVKKGNEIVHRHGFQTGGFIASQHHQRCAVKEGLPTLERHRYMNAFAAAQEMMLLGFDNISFGDDLASYEEMRLLAACQPGPVTLRVEPIEEGPALDRVLGREYSQVQQGLEAFVRSRFGDPENYHFHGGLTCDLKKGDVTMCREEYCRYAGEVHLVKKDLPVNPKVGLIARIISEDQPILEIFNGPEHFRLVRKDDIG